jgi:hypothetical protein
MKEGAAAGASLARARTSVTVLMRSLALLQREFIMLSWLLMHGNAHVRLANINYVILAKLARSRGASLRGIGTHSHAMRATE